jgi:predicted NAD/FAD-dependent oxidoreductase
MSALGYPSGIPTADVLIVGAGLAGLMAARQARAAGLDVLILDEGDEPGGRLATRSLGEGRADIGAQFFTVRTPAFGRLVEEWLSQGWVYEWSRGWHGGSLPGAPPDAPISLDGYPRYAARDGFGALAARLAEGLPRRPSTSLVSVAATTDGWLAADARGAIYAGRALVLTPPASQSLALLDAGGVALPAAERVTLEAIRYGPCLCGLFDMAGEVALPAPGALQRPDQPISWVADNRRKGISPGRPVLTVHAGASASAVRWEESDKTVLDWMLAELRSLLEVGDGWAAPTAVRAAALYRWRYAAPLTTYPGRCLKSSLPTPLIFAGDAFDGPRVEGAALSGLAAASCLRSTAPAI